MGAVEACEMENNEVHGTDPNGPWRIGTVPGMKGDRNDLAKSCYVQTDSTPHSLPICVKWV